MPVFAVWRSSPTEAGHGLALSLPWWSHRMWMKEMEGTSWADIHLLPRARLLHILQGKERTAALLQKRGPSLPAASKRPLAHRTPFALPRF